jgi:hypothetical protein
MVGHRARAVLAVAGAAMLILAIAVPASADATVRPFRGWVAGEVSFVEVPTTVCAPSATVFGGVRTEGSAIGTSTHLGTTVMTSRHCTPAGEAFGPGTMQLVSAQGDEVWIQYTGSAPFPIPGVTTVIDATMQFQIVGGTGRFAEAVGSGTMHAEIVFEGFGDPSWPAWWAWSGTIGY